MTIRKITNANVYLNGINLIGKLDEITLPDIKMKMEDFKALGQYAETELPVGIEKMDLKMKWNAFYPEHLLGANVTTSTNLIIKANVTEFGHLGRSQELPFVAVVNGMWKKIPGGQFKPSENVGGVEHEMTVHFMKQFVDGVPIVEVDVFNNILKIGEIDQLANYKFNI